MPAAVGGILSIQKTAVTGWLIPTGSGLRAIYAYVGISHGGSCALASGKATRVTAIVSIRSKPIKTAAFFVENCVFFPLLFYFIALNSAAKIFIINCLNNYCL
jgi:hypothetical protein